MLEDVLEDCYAVLSAHPTETVIFSVKQEYGDESVAEFQRVLDRYIQEDVERWYLGRALMDVDELAVLDGGKCILQLRGVRPFLSDKFDITQHPNYRFLADADKKNTFDITRFLSTRLKPKPSEVYDVYEVDVSEEDDTAAPE